MDSDVPESPEIQPTLDGFTEPEAPATPEGQAEASDAPAKSPAESEGAAKPEGQTEATEAKERPQRRQGNSGQGRPRRRRRRRGRRRRKPRGQSQHHYSCLLYTSPSPRD